MEKDVQCQHCVGRKSTVVIRLRCAAHENIPLGEILTAVAIFKQTRDSKVPISVPVLGLTIFPLQNFLL